MKNRITSGRFAGSRIKLRNGELYIEYRNERVYFSSDIVNQIQILNIEESRSFISGCLRGMFANLFGKTSWLSAIQSANAKYVYHIKIIYHDGSASGCRVDIDIFEHFAVNYAIA